MHVDHTPKLDILRREFDPSREPLSDDEKLRALMVFHALVNTTIDTYLAEARIDPIQTSLELQIINRQPDGPYRSIVDFQVRNLLVGRHRGRSIHIQEWPKNGTKRQVSYGADINANEVRRYDDDYPEIPAAPSDPQEFDIFRAVTAIHQRLDNQDLAIQMGYNDQAVDVDEIERLAALIDCAKPRS